MELNLKQELKDNLQAKIQNAVWINEAKKKSFGSVGKPVVHDPIKGMKRGLTVAGEGLRGMFASGRHAATGVNMVAKHGAKGIRPVIRKRPLTAVALAAAIGAGGLYAGQKLSDLISGGQQAQKTGVPSGRSVRAPFDFTSRINEETKNSIKSRLNSKLDSRML